MVTSLNRGLFIADRVSGTEQGPVIRLYNCTTGEDDYSRQQHKSYFVILGNHYYKNKTRCINGLSSVKVLKYVRILRLMLIGSGFIKSDEYCVILTDHT